MKGKDLTGISNEDLQKKLSELRQTYSKEYVKTKVGSQSEKAVNTRNIKKDIARVLTAINSRKKGMSV